MAKVALKKFKENFVAQPKAEVVTVKQTKKSIIAEIKQVKELLKSEKQWCQKVFARDETRLVCSPNSPRAVCWDIVGAEIKLNISRQAKVAIQNSALRLFEKTKLDVNDGVDLDNKLSREEKQNLAHANIMMVLEDAITSPCYEQELPEPKREVVKLKPVEVVKTIVQGSSIKPTQTIYDIEGVPQIWYTEANFVPLVCQLQDTQDEFIRVFMASTMPDKLKEFLDGEATTHDLFNVVEYKSGDTGKPIKYKQYWCVLMNPDYTVYSAMELTKRQAENHVKHVEEIKC